MKASIAALLLLSSCATIPSDWPESDWEPDALLELRVGATTVDDACALFGEPLSEVRLNANDSTVSFRDIDVHWLVWSDARGVTLLFDRGHLVRILATEGLEDELLDRVAERVPISARI